MTSPQVIDSEVERALQHAICKANSAFAIALSSSGVSMDVSRKKRKKRTREGTSGTSVELPKEKRRKKTHDLDELSAVPPSASGTSHPTVRQGVAVKTKKRLKHATTPSIRSEADNPVSEIDLSALLDDPSSSASSSQTLTSMSETEEQITQELFCSQAVPNYNPSFRSEDHSMSHLNSNDDILRAFQDLDLTRLAGVLRSLDLPFSPSQSSAQPNSDTLRDDPNASFLDQMYSTSSNLENTTNAAIATFPAKHSGRDIGSGSSSGPSKQKSAKALKPIPQQNLNTATLGPSVSSPEHTVLLASKWLTASKLKSLVETEGLVYKKGKFSNIESQALKAAIEDYRVSHGLSTEQIVETIFSRSKEENTFWPQVAASAPGRPITAVYHHVHRTYHPLRNQGKWLDVEDADLLKAVADCGQAWQKVGARVGRTAQDCRDRWKNHLVNRSERQRGPWTKEEEAELTRIVTELKTKQGKVSENDIFWVAVSQRMGNKRSRQQCRIKWTDSLSKVVKNSGKTPRWNKQDSFILVHKIASLDVRDDSEIDWNTLSDSDWNLWSAHSLQRRWRSLKLSIKGHETMPFGEVIEVLQQKYSELPSVRESKSDHHSREEPKSAEFIEEDEDDDQPAENESGRQEDGQL